MFNLTATVADGVTGVILRLEIHEVKADMAFNDWPALPAGTAWLLTCRHCQPYFGSHHIVRADSAFTSTKAAVCSGKEVCFCRMS